VLRAHGYQTAGFVNNGQLRPYYGFGDDYLLFRRYHGDARDGTALALSWIVRHRVRPFFVFLHLQDPRWPYAAPVRHDLERDDACADCDSAAALSTPDVPVRVRLEVRRRYDAELAFTDLEIGRLYDELARRELLDGTWLIVTATHGQEFWEHGGFMHGRSLHDEVLRVPMIVIPPAGRDDLPRGEIIADQVRLEDVVPTLLEIVDAEPVALRKLDGTSLLPLFTSTDPRTPRPVLAGYLRVEGDASYAVRQDGYKLIVSSADGSSVLYDLQADAEETVDVASGQPERVEQLVAVPREMGSVLPQPRR